MDKDQIQNYDPEIHEEYIIHDTPFRFPATSFTAQCTVDCSIANSYKMLSYRRETALQDAL